MKRIGPYALAAMVLSASLTMTNSVSATPLPSPPTSPFDLPPEGSREYYQWYIDLTNLVPGDLVVEFQVNVPIGGGVLTNMQIFTCAGLNDTSPNAEFDLFVDQPGAMTWTETDPDLCFYHNYDGFLDGGVRKFEVRLANFPGEFDAEIRFGDGPRAVPLPVPALMLMSSVAVLGAFARGRKKSAT